jgi:hypothetical protein
LPSIPLARRNSVLMARYRTQATARVRTGARRSCGRCRPDPGRMILRGRRVRRRPGLAFWLG